MKKLIQSLQKAFRLLFALRRHPKKKVRTAWWAGVFLLILAVCSSPGSRQVASGLWIAVNLVLSGIAFVWVVFHPRALRPALQSSLRWAFVVALFFAFVLFANFESWLSLVDKNAHIPAAAITLTVLFLTPFVFLCCYVQGLIIALFPAYWLRKRPAAESEPSIALYVTFYWLYVGTLSLISLLIGDWTAGFSSALSSTNDLNIAYNPFGKTLLLDVLQALQWGGTLPVFWLVQGWRQMMSRSNPLPTRLIRGISERLILQYRWRGRLRTHDFRGDALGLLAALLMLTIGLSDLLTPVQAVSLNAFLHLRGAMAAENRRQSSGFDEHIVVLTMDSQIRRRALSTSSECAIQAAIIEQLKSYGVRQIVLPTPSLNETIARSGGRGDRNLLLPQSNLDDVKRSERDLRLLRKAIESAGNVIVARPDNRAEANERRVQYAARTSVPLRLPTYSTPRLPIIPTQWTKEIPLPVLCYAAAQKVPAACRIDPADSRFVQIGAARFPRALDGAMLADFGSVESGRRIPHVTYEEVLNNQPLCIRLEKVTPSSTNAPWIMPTPFFEDKIVFLDALTPEEQETATGTMSAIEGQARATHALFDGDLIQRPRGWIPIVLLFLLCAFVGHIGLHRNPLDASWRMAIPAFCLLLAYGVGILLGRLWLDPVLPALAAFFAFLFVTQATYALEHEESGRTRALLERVVDKDVLKELMADPRGLQLGGKKQQVCVIFADVRNFTGFAENRDPQEVIGVINEYMTALTEKMIEGGGIFDKYTGDGLMAFFRITDMALEAQQVQKAVAAAQAMQQAVLEISAQRLREGKTPLDIGIGLHYGEAVVGMVGSPTLANYTALGHTVVVSARLQSIAAGGEVVMSETVYAQTTGLFAEAGELVHVKGISVPVRPYRIRMGVPIPPVLVPLSSATFDLEPSPDSV